MDWYLGRISSSLSSSVITWSSEEGRLREAVKKNPSDYHSWMVLIHAVEADSTQDLKTRKVYEEFLNFFPLCTSYWKKLADIVKGTSKDDALKVYDRATKTYAVYSVEFWENYCEFAQSFQKDPIAIRRLFNKALDYVGPHYTSHRLWMSYICYEERMQDKKALARIYAKIFENTVQDLELFFERFRKSAAEMSGSDLIVWHERLPLDPSDFDNKPVSMPEVLEAREKSYIKAKEYEEEVLSFEQAISRSSSTHDLHCRYPVDDADVAIWHSYIDHAERHGATTKVTALYQRCLTICPHRADLWIRYIEHLETNKLIEEATSALSSALLFIHEDGARQEFSFFIARYKERNDDVAGARQQYAELSSAGYHGLYEVLEAHANFEHRVGNDKAACLVYKNAIEMPRDLSVQVLLVLYARYSIMVLQDMPKWKEILNQLMQFDLTKPIVNALIDLQYMCRDSKQHIILVSKIVKKYLSSDPTHGHSQDDKFEISSRFLKLVRLFGDRISTAEGTKNHLEQFHVFSSLKRTRQNSSSRASKKVKKEVECNGEGICDVIVLRLDEFLQRYQDHFIAEIAMHLGGLDGKKRRKIEPLAQMLLRALYFGMGKRHVRNLSFAGNFTVRDVQVLYDGCASLICKFLKTPSLAKQTSDFVLDYTTIKNIVCPFILYGDLEKGPSYIGALFQFSLKVPFNMISDETSRKLFLKRISAQPGLKSPVIKINLFRDIFLFFNDVCKRDADWFNNIFTLHTFCDSEPPSFASIVNNDKLLKAICPHEENRQTSAKASKYVKLFRHLDAHGIDFLEPLVVTAIKLEEFCHLLDSEFETVICGLVDDLCIACSLSTAHPRLMDILDRYISG